MRFNFFRKKAVLTTNYEGAKAYSMTPETELYAAVVTGGLSDTFYEKSGTRIERLRELMTKTDPEYVARLAVYTRSAMYMRSVPLVLAVELAKQTNGNDLVRKTVNKVVQRADEITELLAYYQSANERDGVKKLGKLSKQIQRGLGDAFNRFDEYQFSKYNRGTEVKLRDALFLVHPKAKDDSQQAIFNRIAAKELATAYTWETELSAIGQRSFATPRECQAAFREKWEELIDSGKLGYMALLRNLRNIIEADVSLLHMSRVCTRIGNAAEVAKSKQLPVRFLAAYREVEALRSIYVIPVQKALENAVIASAENIKGFDGNPRVLIACDVSGSMMQCLSPRSKVMMVDLGLMLAMLFKSTCDGVVTGIFGTDWKKIKMPSANVLSNVAHLRKLDGKVGYATNGYKIIKSLIANQTVMDKVMMFTDCQLYDARMGGADLQQTWLKYKNLAPNARLYLFDLAGLGKAPIATFQDDVCVISGWSDKIFDVLYAIENGGSAVEIIKAIEL